MSLSSRIRRLLEHPLAKELDLDSAEATRVHSRLIREKPAVRALYDLYYERFLRSHRRAPDGARLEIGAGGGFLQELVPQLITLDLRPAASVDLRGSALDIPLAASSVGAIFMLNVLHHLPSPEPFFLEVQRVLKPGGRLTLIEPYVSPLSRLIYTHLHHEPFDPSAQWTTPHDGPLSSGNDALPWIVLVRDSRRFAHVFLRLTVETIEPHTILLYMLSGGVSMRSFMPAFAVTPLDRLERSLGPLNRYLASMMTVEIVRQPE